LRIQGDEHMKNTSAAIAAASFAVLACSLAVSTAHAAESRQFRIEEATIADVHRAMRARQLTAEQLVGRYLQRIKAYNGACVEGEVDARGYMMGDIKPVANAGQLAAYTTLNLKEDKRKALGFPERLKRTHTGPENEKMPDALDRARELDAQLARTGKLAGPLHGIPIAVKDLFDTADMRTTAGSIADYADDRPRDDATVIARLRAAGAIILGKTNMDEYAPGGVGRSTFGGQSCNPYDTTRIAGGSSGGSGAAVAANLAMCGTGTDTSSSVRNPATYNNITGMIATQGLISRDGISPLSFSRDRAGILCRTIADTALVMETLVGYDPKDDVTALAHGVKPQFRRAAEAKALKGKRLGVLRDFMIEVTLADRDSVRIANEALADMKRLGAVLVDPVNVQDAIAAVVPYYEPGVLPKYFPSLFPPDAAPIDRIVDMAFDHSLVPAGPRGLNLRRLAFQPRGPEGKYALNRYLRDRGDAKFKSTADVFATPTFSGQTPNLVRAFGDANTRVLDTPNHTEYQLRIQTMRQVMLKVMADNNLDAFVYVNTTVPAHIVLPNRQPAVEAARTEPAVLKAGTRLSNPALLPDEPVLKTDLDTYRGPGAAWAVHLSPMIGFPAVVIPAGFTREVYDRVPDASEAQGSRLVGPVAAQLPVAMEFLGRPFGETKLLEIAAGYEAGTKHRRAPKAFGPVPAASK
jgi:Asp-tRNA(Asn)/Glu-tRNA(Gln) amidotransferase A subunit family amidase